MAGLKPCGTEAAYRRHRTAGEVACDACKAANAAATARRRAEGKARRLAASRDAAGVGSVLPEGAVLVAREAKKSEGPTREKDLKRARNLLMGAMYVLADADPAKLPPVVKELREVWNALDPKPAPERVEEPVVPVEVVDEFSAALAARRAGRKAGG